MNCKYNMFSSNDTKHSLKKPSPIDVTRGRTCDILTKQRPQRPVKGECTAATMKGDSSRNNACMFDAGLGDMRK